MRIQHGHLVITVLKLCRYLGGRGREQVSKRLVDYNRSAAMAIKLTSMTSFF